MKDTKLFQYGVMGAFIFFIIVGAILFSTYRSDSEENSQIAITMWGTLAEDSFNAFVSQYFSQSELKYTIDYVERDPTTFDRDLIEALASGVGPDAIVLPENLIVRYANKIFPIPYDTLPELTFKQTFVQEGELYLSPSGILALPFSVDPLVMYWNRDIFNNVSVTVPPTTWSEISNLVPKITLKDKAQNISRSTVALGEFRNVVNAKDILSALLIQSGNSIVGVGTDGKLFSKINEGADLPLQFFANFSNPVRREYSWNRSLNNSLDVFANGDLAIYFGFASEFMKIKEKNPNLNFDVSVLPQIANAKVYNTFGSMLGFAIMRNSLNPAATFTVLSTITSAQAFPFWKNIFNIPSARRDILSIVDKSAVKTVFNNSAIISKGWLDPNSAQTRAIFQDMIESYTTGRENIEGAVSTASDRLDSILNSKF